MTNDRTQRSFLKAGAVVGVIIVMLMAVHDRLTAESRFNAKLDAELQSLNQSGANPAALSTAERERYLALLRCNDQPSRWQAAGDLARLRDKTFVPALVAAMQDDDGTRRTCLMAQSLGAIGDSNAVPALLEASGSTGTQFDKRASERPSREEKAR